MIDIPSRSASRRGVALIRIGVAWLSLLLSGVACNGKEASDLEGGIGGQLEVASRAPIGEPTRQEPRGAAAIGEVAATVSEPSLVAFAVSVEVRGGNGSGLCSGAVWESHLVLTAGHCVERTANVTVAVGPERAGPVLRTPALVLATHPSIDLAVLRTAEPLGLPSPEIEVRSPRESEATIVVGYGARVEGGVRRWIPSTVSKVREDYFLIRPMAEQGPCTGDSGGPVWAVEPSGEFTLLGILTTGSSRCLGPDKILRLDAVRKWLEEIGVPSGGA